MSESIWKKEIRLRKPKAEQVEVPQVEAVSASKPEQSVWKKEIRLRKPKVEQVEAAEEEAVAEPEPEPSFWKKERTVRKKLEPVPLSPEHLLESARRRSERPRGTVVVPVVPVEPKSTDPIERVERQAARVPAPVPGTEFPRQAPVASGHVNLLPASEPPLAPVDPEPVSGWSQPQPVEEPPPIYGWADPEPVDETTVPGSAEPSQEHEFHSWSALDASSDSAVSDTISLTPEPVDETPVPGAAASNPEREFLSWSRRDDPGTEASDAVLPPPVVAWSLPEADPAARTPDPVAESSVPGSAASSQEDEFRTWSSRGVSDSGATDEVFPAPVDAWSLPEGDPAVSDVVSFTPEPAAETSVPAAPASREEEFRAWAARAAEPEPAVSDAMSRASELVTAWSQREEVDPPAADPGEPAQEDEILAHSTRVEVQNDAVSDTVPVAAGVPWSLPEVDPPAPAPAEPSPEHDVVSEPPAEGLPDTELSETVALTPEHLSVVAAEKVPLLKREISFKRKPKREQPKAEPPKVAAAPKEQAATSDKTPLLKREISLKRKSKQPNAKAPKPEQTQKVLSLKREIHLPRPSRKPKPAGEHRVTRVIGLRVGSSQLTAAHIQNNGSHELVQLAYMPIDRGLVVAGEVRDAEGLTRELKAFFAANKLPKKDVRLGIASNRIGVRVLDVPAVDDPKQFENAIRFRAQELLPIPVTDAILDHVVLGEAPNDEGDVMRRVLLVFAHRELVNRFVDVCRGAGVRLSGIDLDAFALLRAVADPSDEGHAVVAVAIGHERTVLAVSDGRICDFARVLEWGGSSIDVAIARTLNLTPSQAEPVKQILVLGSDEKPDGLTAVQYEAVKAAVTSEIGVLGRELVSSLRFYQSRPDAPAIAEVVIAGGAAQLQGLPAELQRLLGAPVRMADPFARVTLGKRVTMPDASGSLAIAIGLGIEV